MRTGLILTVAMLAAGAEVDARPPSKDALKEQLLGRWRPHGQQPGDDALGDPEDMLETFRADGTGTSAGFRTTWTLKADVVSMVFPDKGVAEFKIAIRGDDLIETNVKTGSVLKFRRLKPGEEP